VYGFEELLSISSRLCLLNQFDRQFDVEILTLDQIEQRRVGAKDYAVIFLPPSLDSIFYLDPAPALLAWLVEQHGTGSKLCSACAGSFIIAATGLLEGREATTHWALADSFREHFPAVELDVDKIMINDSDIVTAGGMMSWLDLGLELAAVFTTPAIMSQLGRQLVVDTAPREQRYYQVFLPKRDHGDKAILDIQAKLQSEYMQPVRIADLAEFSFLTKRTFLRRFVNATGLKPNEYLQRLRVQKCCDLLERSHYSFERISNEVGYEDVSACRKVFTRIMGLTPKEFRHRFASVE
jgi:transcriptional regulator GlxA family with amidase domain